jgi:predicted nucleic acid-binding protein
MICVDASLVAKLLFPEEESSTQAFALMADELSAEQPMIAPPLLPIEVTNILRQRMRREGLSLERARELLRQFLAIPINLKAPEGLYDEALVLADAQNHPAAYDAHYVALAQRMGCDLWTADERLMRALAGRLAFVRSIADFVANEPDDTA